MHTGRWELIIVSVVWSFVASVIAFYIAKKLVGLRVSSDEESEGLDLASHGERGYNL